MKLTKMLRTGALGSLFVLAAFASGSAVSERITVLTDATAHRHRPIIIRERRDQTVSSTNWNGYAVETAGGAVTNAKGSWIVPAVTCPSSPNEYAAFWVGIDGFNSNTVEQVGTDSDCQSGVPTYYAWFEFYPHPSLLINSLSIQPGNVMSGEVSYNPQTKAFTVSITNMTTGQSFSGSSKVKSAKRSSAEWIAEAPSGSGGILPLAEFGTASYGYDNTAVASTSDATVGAATGPIGSFGGSVVEISMVNESGTAIKAAPSALSSDGSSFFDTWYSSGP